MHLDFERAWKGPKSFGLIQVEHRVPIQRWSQVDTDEKSTGIDNAKRLRFE
jgi:hypothetical protein